MPLAKSIEVATVKTATFVFHQEIDGDVEERPVITNADGREMEEILQIVERDEESDVLSWTEEELDLVDAGKASILYSCNGLQMSRTQIGETSVTNFWESRKSSDNAEPIHILVCFKKKKKRKRRSSSAGTHVESRA